MRGIVKKGVKGGGYRRKRVRGDSLGERGGRLKVMNGGRLEESEEVVGD